MALEDDITVLDDGTKIYRGETKNRMLDEALAMALDTEYKPLYPDTPVEKMYDNYFFYDCTIMTLEMGEYPLSEFIKDKEGRKLRGAELVQYVFRLHDTEISLEQAAAFVPFFYHETLVGVGGGTDDEPDNQLDIDVKNLFESQDFWESIKAMYDYYTAIEPYLLQELDKMHDLHPETNEDKWVTLNDLKALLFVYEDFPDEELEPLFDNCKKGRPRQVFMQRKMPFVYFYHKYFEYIYTAVKAAKQAVSKELEPIKEEPLRQKQAFTNVPNISSLLLQHIVYPIDKVNNTLWDNFPTGKRQRLKAESDKDNKKGKTADVFLTLDFEKLNGVEISHPLTTFDKQVLVAISNLAMQGQYITTAAQIDKLMGATTKANKTDKKKILDSIESMATGRVTIDNTEEAKLYSKYDHIVGKFPLLVASTVTAYIDGQITDNAIKISEIPAIFLYAYNRGQVTTYPIEVFQTPINKNEANRTLEDYLRRRIAQMNPLSKNKGANKIKIDTICEKCKITTPKQKERLKDKLPKILNWYVKVKFIKGYKIDKTSITIKL